MKKEPAPEIDFTKSRLACIFWAKSGFQRIIITGITETEKEIVVDHCLDGPDVHYGRAGYRMFCVVEVPAGKKPVRFEMQEVHVNGR